MVAALFPMQNVPLAPPHAAGAAGQHDELAPLGLHAPAHACVVLIKHPPAGWVHVTKDVPLQNVPALVHAAFGIEQHWPPLQARFDPHSLPLLAGLLLSMHISDPVVHEYAPSWQGSAGVQVALLRQVAHAPLLQT